GPPLAYTTGSGLRSGAAERCTAKATLIVLLFGTSRRSGASRYPHVVPAGTGTGQGRSSMPVPPVACAARGGATKVVSVARAAAMAVTAALRQLRNRRSRPREPSRLSQATLARFRDGLSHGNPFEIICPGTGWGRAPGRGGGITRRREAGPRAAARPDHPPASAWIDRGRAWITCRRAWIT